MAALRETRGDVAAVAERFGMSADAIYKAAERAGVSIRALQFSGAGPDLYECGDSVRLSRTEYLTLVAQADALCSVGAAVWADAERTIAVLTRHVQELAARVAAQEGRAAL